MPINICQNKKEFLFDLDHRPGSEMDFSVDIWGRTRILSFGQITPGQGKQMFHVLELGKIQWEYSGRNIYL